MIDKCSYVAGFDSLADWGCELAEVATAAGLGSVKICHVKVSDLSRMAENLTSIIMDQSWMLNLDKGVRRSYEMTVKETSSVLVQIFRAASESTSIAADFGELMVSMGASKGLEALFEHESIPVAELWKPQVKQNEGFDFHTVCTADLINFGEAKFSSSVNPHGKALDQIEEFVEAEKHYRDRVHLVSLSGCGAVTNLDGGLFGVIAAFSINTEDPLNIFANALESVRSRGLAGKISAIYLVGVSYAG